MNPASLLPDILQLFGIDAGSSGVSQLVDPAAAATGFDAAMSVDLGTVLGGFDPAAMSAELATLLENLCAALVPELATSLLNVF